MSAVLKRDRRFIGRAPVNIFLRVLIVVTATLGGMGLVTSNVFALLTASAFNTTGGSVTTGTLLLTVSPSTVNGITGGFTSAISALGPGDTVNRYVDLTIGGTLDAANPTLQILATTDNTLVTDTNNGLQVTITGCSVEWTNTGTCSGTTSTVLAQTSAANLRSASRSLVLPTLFAGGINRLKVTIFLPSGDENVENGNLPVGTVQGLTNSLTWKFAVTERAATTTHS
jgi:hypothetical protein